MTMKRLLATLIFACLPTWAAIPAATQWEIRNGGNDTNGGGYSTGGTDMSVYDNKNATGCTGCQSASNNLSVTDGTSNNTTTLESTNADFTSAIVGNVIYVAIGGGACDSGTVSAQWRHVAAYVDENTITLDAAPAGSGTNCTGLTINIGGALASPGQSTGIAVAGNTIWLKYNATAFSVTSTSSNVSNGRLTFTNGSAAAPIIMWGYESTRGDETDNRPTIAWGVDSVAPIVTMGTYVELVNIIIDGKRATPYTSMCVSGLVPNLLYRVKVKDCAAYGLLVGSAGNPSFVYASEFENNGNGAAPAIDASAARVYVDSSYIHDSPASGVLVTTGALIASNTIFDTNKVTTARSGIVMTGAGFISCVNCVVYNSGSHGIDVQVSATITVENSYFEANGGYGINFTQATAFSRLLNNAGYNNSTGDYTTANIPANKVVNWIAISAGTALTDAAGGVFTINNTASRGALLRAAGFPSTFPAGLTASYRDIGAAQHKEPARMSGYAQ